MSRFQSGALILGVGRPASLQRALKTALFLTDADGPGYSCADTEIALEHHAVPDIDGAVARMAQRSAKAPYGRVWVHLCGDLHNGHLGAATGDGGLAGTGVSLTNLIDKLASIPARQLALTLDAITPTNSTDIADQLINAADGHWEDVAILCATHVEQHPPHTNGSPANGSPANGSQQVNGRGPNGSSRRKSGRPSFTDWLLDWMTGRKASLNDPVMFSALAMSASRAAPANQWTVRCRGDEDRLRLARTYPWLGWTRRTTMPGHVVSSLSQLVDDNWLLLLDRLGQQPLGADTLAGFDDSLFAALWCEAQYGEGLEHMEKLARDRRIIEQTLAREGHNRTATAESLGISRSTLYEKMRRLGISTSTMAGAYG